LANAIYAALVEGHAAEISARRNAMDNASKNAGDMISSLQMKYNRGRQAAITNELVDIITGASGTCPPRLLSCAGHCAVSFLFVPDAAFPSPLVNLLVTRHIVLERVTERYVSKMELTFLLSAIS
jgi:hypothetical protein